MLGFGSTASATCPWRAARVLPAHMDLLALDLHVVSRQRENFPFPHADGSADPHPDLLPAHHLAERRDELFSGEALVLGLAHGCGPGARPEPLRQVPSIPTRMAIILTVPHCLAIPPTVILWESCEYVPVARRIGMSVGARSACLLPRK